MVTLSRHAAIILLVGAFLGASTASAGARTLAPLNPGASALTRSTVFPLRDRVLQSRPGRARARAASTPERAYRAPDGTTVSVALSDSFAATPDNQAAVQSYVNFLSTRLHGGELNSLHVFIGSPAEINALCGGGAGVLACYIAGEQRMYVPSQDPTAGRTPFTREYVVTHELGHHIARSRRNDPFPALDFGPKYWSSYKHVCAGVLADRYFPGNQGSHYVDDPGESFADSYAHLHFPAVPWQFNPTLAPDPGAFAAIRQDVLGPWSGPKATSVRRLLTSRRRVRSFPVFYSLDGEVSLRLSGPSRANYDLEVLEAGRVVARSRARGSRDTLRGAVCRPDAATTASLTVRVRRRSGSGLFTLRIAYPG